MRSTSKTIMDRKAEGGGGGQARSKQLNAEPFRLPVVHLYKNLWEVIERHIMSNDDDPFNRMPRSVKADSRRSLALWSFGACGCVGALRFVLSAAIVFARVGSTFRNSSKASFDGTSHTKRGIQTWERPLTPRTSEERCPSGLGA